MLFVFHLHIHVISISYICSFACRRVKVSSSSNSCAVTRKSTRCNLDCYSVTFDRVYQYSMITNSSSGSINYSNSNMNSKLDSLELETIVAVLLQIHFSRRQKLLKWNAVFTARHVICMQRTVLLSQFCLSARLMHCGYFDITRKMQSL